MSGSRRDFLDNIKINLETTARCGGSCMGCMLESQERRHGSIWGMERLNEIGPLVEGFISGHLSRFDPLEVSINCGQGDHLLAEPDELANLVEWMARVGQGRVIGFMTASAIGKTDRVKHAVDAIREASLRLNQPVLLDLVFDPVKTTLDGFKETYAANIEYIRAAFGGVDFAINVGPDTVQKVAPADLHQFARRSGVSRLTLNLTPTLASAMRFLPIWADIVEWAAKVLELWNPADGYELNLGQVLATTLSGSAGLAEADPSEVLQLVELSASRSIYIDNDNAIWHTQEGFGDIAFSRRVGWSSASTIPQLSRDVMTAIDRSARDFTVRSSRPFRASTVCGACRFINVCPRIGVAALHQTVRTPVADNMCPVGILPLLETVEASTTRQNIEGYMCKKDFTHLPVGFDAGARRRAAPITPVNKRLEFGVLGVIK